MELARVFNGEKFMWDERVYTSQKERKEIAQKY